jgi:hypothetical protein
MGYARPPGSRRFFRIAGKPVLVDRDMPANAISLCPNYGPTTKPCTMTLPLATGRSGFVFVGGAAVVLDQARGPTDGIPPGLTSYAVRAPGQFFVSVSG